MRFQKVIVLGSGKIAVECIRILVGYREDIITIEHEEHPLSFVRLISWKYGLPYHLINDKQHLLAYLEGIGEETLVISVNNNYLFPEQILNKKNLSIINFHNALLPNYPGRNAPTWVIFNGEDITGITWHMVDEGIDTGNILIQRMVIVDPLITAFQLTKQCMDVGIEAFRQIIPGILGGRFSCDVQDIKQRKNFHTAKEMPNHGYMEIDWPVEKISGFLRSLDYGKAHIFPSAKLVVLGKEYFIRKYGILPEATLENHITFEKNEIIFQDNGQIIRVVLEREEENEGIKRFAEKN